VEATLSLGYLEDGSELLVTFNQLGRGLLLSGIRCQRIVRSIVWELHRRGEPILLLCFHESLSGDFESWLQSADSEALTGYAFTYDVKLDAYSHLLTNSLCFGLSLDEDSEFIVRDSVRALAGAAGAGGPIALLSMLPDDGGRKVDWTRKRLEELVGTPYMTAFNVVHSCFAKLWNMPSLSARVAIGLACACKFALAKRGWVVFLGWNAVTSVAVKSFYLRGKLSQIISEVKGLGGHLVALEEGGQRHDGMIEAFNLTIEERGPFFVLQEVRVGRGRTFAAPNLTVQPVVIPKGGSCGKTKQIERVLKVIRKYPNTTLLGLLSFLKGEVDEEELKLTIQEVLQKGYARAMQGASAVKVLVLTPEGERFLSSQEAGAK
jgi:hypothetical protein